MGFNRMWLSVSRFCFYIVELSHKIRGALKTLLLSCTQTRGRTGMDVTPLVFETSASTDSAIWATVFSIAVQRYGDLFNLPNFRSAFFFYLYKKEQKTRLCSLVTGAA